MRGLEKFVLIVFSLLIIFISVTLVLVSTDMISIDTVTNVVSNIVTKYKVVFLCIGAIMALFGIVGLFATSSNSENIKGGLAIKGETGTVYITKDTFESIIMTVTRAYAELKNVRVEMIVNETGVSANVYTMILPETVVPTLTAKLQENIKSSVLKQTTVEIKEVNIKIKGVYQEVARKQQ